MPKVSVVMATWNTSHLLRRSLVTYCKQTMDDFEIIVIDDNSEDDVAAVVEPFKDRLNIKVHHLTHSFGMRDSSVSFNLGFSLAQGDFIFENTPEILLYPDAILHLVGAMEELGQKSWVSVRTYNLTPEDQLLIDTVDWEKDVTLLETLPNFQSEWTQNNVKMGTYFGTHQSCLYYREDWFKYYGRWPFFLDYGTSDPWLVGVRRRNEIQDATLTPLLYHQWHCPTAVWQAHGKAPNWNAWGHTMKNHYNDPLVPDGGTAAIWDKDKPEGPNHQQTPEEAAGWAVWKDTVIKTGFRRKDGKEW